MNKVIAGTAIALALGFTSAPAFAATSTQQVLLCAAELEAQNIAPADQYRAKFLKSRGAATKTITIKLVPNGDGVSKTAVCKIKRGKVVEAKIKA